jgi:hypothetical protein
VPIGAIERAADRDDLSWASRSLAHAIGFAFPTFAVSM